MSNEVFNKGVNRIGTNSVKYDKYKENFNTDRDDIIPMWIADMDFETCDEITKALIKKVSTGNLGYDTVKGYKEAVVNWMKKRHDLDINIEDIVYTPGIVTAINFLLKVLVKEDDKVLVQSPVYHSFFRVLNENKCDIIQSELVINDNLKEVNIYNVVSEVIYDFEMINKNVKFTYNIEDNLKLTMMREHLKQLLIIFIDNSIAYFSTPSLKCSHFKTIY